jgi:hypothetical protein
MKKYTHITLALAAASCGLLNTTSTHASLDVDKQNDIAGWDISTAVLFYSEVDRVSAIEAALQGKKALDTDEYLTLKITLDSLTGASASGAVPAEQPQTFTRPSGKGSYQSTANKTVLDDSFRDTRLAINTQWEKPLSRTVKMILGSNISKEYDYLSLSGNGLFAFDFNQRNTTFSAGVSLASDRIDPEGHIPTAFGIMRPQGEEQPREGGSSESKTTVDLLLGVTQVMDRNSLVQLNYSFSQTHGYLTDPFKVLSVIDDTGRPVIEDTASNLSQVVFEHRPNSRNKHSLYSKYKRYLNGDVIDVSYRYLFDNWDLSSHTMDLHYRYKLSSTRYIQPYLRYYKQSGVNFYKPFLLSNEVPSAGSLDKFATADYRLGDLNAYTIGLEYGHTHSRPWSIGIDYYIQNSTEPEDTFGELKKQRLAADFKALMLRINYDY